MNGLTLYCKLVLLSSCFDVLRMLLTGDPIESNFCFIGGFVWVTCD